ncbi:MAG: hypothetical protein IPK19_36850 [Chloroflexi bacterium]|nr:hypothetical protein [Chloroflexota bacterium]
MALVAVVSVLSFTFNIVTSLSTPYIWAGSPLRWFTGIYPPYIALMNVLLLIQVAVAATTTVEPRTIRAVHRLAVAGLLSVFLVGPVITVNLPQDTRLLQEVDVGEGARLVGYRMVDEGEHVMLTLYWQATRLIPTLYRSHLELVHDGRVIAISDGSAEEVRPGSWRWNRGRVYPVTYWFDLTEKPDPDAIRAMFYEDSTRRTLTVTQNGAQLPCNTLVLEASR